MELGVGFGEGHVLKHRDGLEFGLVLNITGTISGYVLCAFMTT